ncbi:hypothetical protein Jiend_23190 [Micromonospora endophytica]|nr:hypothetical protein Jiend_23190 [Micromonospora endophytica]
MQPAGPPLPELDRLGSYPQPAPVLGAGIGSTSANRSAAARYASSSAARSGSTDDWALAHAPSREPRGRLAKYASVSARSTGSTEPATTTCRCMGNHGNTRLAYGLVSASAPLRDR